ncbi:MAG: orotidine-5'-phosphate decarboxylase [Firmicutes bacterium]|nr:orotidine-5'-phosphate decarboxylase [Bacillota bacterium]
MAVKLWVALDLPHRDDVERMLQQLGSHRHVKVGMELFYRLGPDYVRSLADRGYHIFLDLKCHDIPRTAGRAVAAVRDLGIEMLTLHAAGGLEMLDAARQEAGTVDLIAVTVLTSLDDAALADAGIRASVDDLAMAATRLAQRAGLAGVVTSAEEALELRGLWPGARLVVPGIRLMENARGDQRRVMGPREAVERGATDLVVGRPIVEASDPAAALERFLAIIQES